MAFTVVGYEDAPVGETDWGRILGQSLADYSVDAPGSLAPSIIPSGVTRGVRIAAGSATGRGVRATEASQTDLPADEVTSGTVRWDTVVLRRTRGEGAGAELLILEGTSARAISSARESLYTSEHDDQPIALIKVVAGQSTLGDIVDLRCWAGNGGLVALDALALGYLADRPGTRVVIGSTEYVRQVNGAGAVTWEASPRWPSDVGWTSPTVFGVYSDWAPTSTVKARIREDRIEFSGILRRGANLSSIVTIPQGDLGAVARWDNIAPTVDRVTSGGSIYVNGGNPSQIAGPAFKMTPSGNLNLYMPRTASWLNLDGLWVPR